MVRGDNAGNASRQPRRFLRAVANSSAASAELGLPLSPAEEGMLRGGV